jgi:hypothetical protein
MGLFPITRLLYSNYSLHFLVPNKLARNLKKNGCAEGVKIFLVENTQWVQLMPLQIIWRKKNQDHRHNNICA